jgi:hypothetical protein
MMLISARWSLIDGTFTYTPDEGNDTGADSFTYTVSDQYGGTSETATVAITLTNADPVAQDDTYSNGHNLELDVTGDPIADVIRCGTGTQRRLRSG